MATALITGAGGNLGVEFARALQDLDIHVILTDLNESAVAKRVEAFGQLDSNRLQICHLDITSESQVARLANKIGPLSVLINNAQGSDPDEDLPFEEASLNAWRQLLEVNLTGPFLCCKHFGSVMANNQRGSIINVASIYALMGPDFRIYENQDFLSPAIYSASKAGVVGLTRYLATYWAPKNVRVNCISPGGMQISQSSDFVTAYSDRIPQNRMGQPSELRGVIRWLASKDSSYVTGQNIYIDGGLSAW